MDRSKKILIDLGKLKNRYSGLGEVSFNFAKTLSDNISLLEKENFQVHLMVPKKWVGKFGDHFTYVSPGFFRRYFPFLYKPYDLWYAIHQDSAYLPGNRSTKLLLTIHDLNFIFKKDKKKVARRLAQLQKKINKTNYITTISHFTKSEVQKHFQLQDIPVEVIYCGVINSLETPAEKPGGVNENEKFFFHISTIMPKKNVMVLVDMMKLMPGNKLVIAGSWDSGYAKEILSRIKEENITNIITLSKISDQQKAWLFRNCEAFFFPSFEEGFGLPVIESMYCGKPVFASTYTSLPEIGSDKAFYWHSFEPEYMRDVVLEKMESIQGDAAFANRLQVYASEFTWQRNVTRYIRLFKELLS